MIMIIAIILAFALAVLLVLRYTNQSKVGSNRYAPTGPHGDGDGDKKENNGGSGVL
jgi:hypothetical protein